MSKHLSKHWWNYKKKTYNYDEKGNLSSVLKLTSTGKGERDYFRIDGSLEKREFYEKGQALKDMYELYYPSGRLKYQSFETS